MRNDKDMSDESDLSESDDYSDLYDLPEGIVSKRLLTLL